MTQERIIQWQNVLRNWHSTKDEYAKYSAPIGGLLLPFLEGFFADTYGENLKVIVEVLKRARFNPKDVPLAAYILIHGEQIEPVIREKLAFMMETKIFTTLEYTRTHADYFGYLMGSNSEESKENYTKVLNREVAYIGKMLIESYGKGGLRPAVLENVAKAIQHHDLAAKQFVIVVAIYLEERYRKTFVPDVVDAQHPFRAKPRRFIYFTTQILPEKFRKLKLGIFSGLLEFMNEIRPAYCMID